MPLQQGLGVGLGLVVVVVVGCDKRGWRVGPGRTIVVFVGGCDAEKGYVMSVECWLQSIHSSPMTLAAFKTPSYSWMKTRKSGEEQVGGGSYPTLH